MASPGTVSLFRASDSSHGDSGTSTNQSWFHSCRNNVQGPLEAFTILSLVMMEPEAFHQLAILGLNSLFLFYSLDLSAAAQVFLFLYLNLPGSLHLEFKSNSCLLHRIAFCTILSFTYPINIIECVLYTDIHIGIFPSCISLLLNNSAFLPEASLVVLPTPLSQGRNLLFCFHDQSRNI